MNVTLRVTEFFIPPLCPRCGWIIGGSIGRCALVCTNCNTEFEAKN